MNLSFFSITKEQTNITKGIAMIIIVLHNYLHWFFDIGENEFKFNPDNIWGLFSFIGSDYKSTFSCLISYFGFYALECFIFLSGFGLVKQSLKKGEIPYFKYLLPKITKLYTLLIVGFISYFCIISFIAKPGLSFKLVVSTFLMYNNFSFDTIFSIVGPWWYFSLILQLYILYPLLYKVLLKYKEKGAIALVILSYVFIFLLSPLANRYNFPIYGNFLGHLPEFILGMSIAMFKEIRITWKIYIFAFFTFALSNFYITFSPFRFLSATILMLGLIYPIINMRNSALRRGLTYVGSISMFIFIINGPLRIYTHFYITDKPYIIQFLISLFHLAIVIADAALISFMYNKTFEQINRLLSIVKESITHLNWKTIFKTFF